MFLVFNIRFSGPQNLIDIIYGCLNEAAEMHTRGDKHVFMLEKVRACVKDLSYLDKNSNRRPKYNWHLATNMGLTIDRLCRECFARCYGCSHNLVDACCKELSLDNESNHVSEVRNVEKSFNDRSSINRKDKTFAKDIEVLAKSKEIDLTTRQKALLYLPNTENAKFAYQWMDWYFDKYGCKVPNSDQIHLEHMDLKELWTEYFDDMGEEYAYGYEAFLKLWKVCFPHVRVREFKQCCGKCMTCLKLTEARRTTRDKNKKDYITTLFGYHRISFMGERATYANRRFLARMYPRQYVSTIMDGMAQLHCLLPYFANKYAVSVNYKQHIQGIINHGRSLTLYRTFNNIYNGANLAIHTWLLNLENVYRSEGKLPDIVFAQIDGGNENANTAMKGICELLVARRLTKKVVLTRLPPGHTHEDIDSVYGKIWKYLEGKAIYTPQAYERALRIALHKRNINVIIEDIICVPNYRMYMKDYVDAELTRCDKLRWTELEWTFEEVDKCVLYPNGVKVTYRKWTQDEVFVIDELQPQVNKPANDDGEHVDGEVDQEKSKSSAQKLWESASECAKMYGFDFRLVKINKHPLPEKDGDPDGMYILKSLPDGTKEFHPQPFIKGSRKELESLVKKMVKTFGHSIPGLKEEWEAWRDFIAPNSDDSTEFCARHPMHIPFKEELFSGSIVNLDQPTRPHVPKPRHEMPPEYETTNSVIWSNRGHRSKYT